MSCHPVIKACRLSGAKVIEIQLYYNIYNFTVSVLYCASRSARSLARKRSTMEGVCCTVHAAGNVPNGPSLGFRVEAHVVEVGMVLDIT
jgi:hypothetical protein